MSDESFASVTQWLAGMKSGDDDAFEQIWQRYFTSLVGLARKTLASTAGTKGNEEDVAQSAFESFYFRAKEGRFPQLNDRDDLWKLLITITLRKAWKERRRAFRRGPAADPGCSGQRAAGRVAEPRDGCSYDRRIPQALWPVEQSTIGYRSPDEARGPHKSPNSQYARRLPVDR
jgi:DNA-directed RNA polymerase specialized sigma24 family protein